MDACRTGAFLFRAAAHRPRKKREAAYANGRRAGDDIASAASAQIRLLIAARG